MNFQEVINEIDELGISKSDFAYDDMQNPFPKAGPWKEVFQKGGEDEGSDWQSVKHFVDHDIFVRICGYYTSYDGADFNGYEYEEVFPQQEVITVYGPAKQD